MQLQASRMWWAWLFRGVFALIFAILAFVMPGITLTSLIFLFGSFMFVDGIFALGAVLLQKEKGRSRGLLVVEGLLGLGVGLITFWMPGLTAITLLFFVASWAIVTGVLEIALAIEWRKVIGREWSLALSGLLSIVFGLLLIIFPSLGLISFAWMLGFYALLSGLLMLNLSFQLRKILKGGSQAPGSLPLRGL